MVREARRSVKGKGSERCEQDLVRREREKGCGSLHDKDK